MELNSPSNNNQLLIELKGPKQYQIGLEVIIQQIQDETVTAPFKSKSSGPYRYVVVKKSDNVIIQNWKIIVCLFIVNNTIKGVLTGNTSVENYLKNDEIFMEEKWVKVCF